MAGWKRSKTKDGPKKGQEAKKKSIKKLIEQNSKNDPSNSNSIVGSGTLKKAPSSTTVADTGASTMLARTIGSSNSFSETARTFVASPPKKKPRVKLASRDQIPHKAFQPSSISNSPLLQHISRPHKQPKSIVPGVPQDSRCREPNFLIIDRRHDLGSLIRLPKEPDVMRTPNFVREGVFRFLDLPVELRLPIYEYLIQPECYAIQWVDGKRKSKLLTHSLPQRSAACQPRMSMDTLTRRQDLTKHRFHPDKATLMKDQYCLPSPVSLLWVCRQIYTEASTIFYSNSLFTFTLLSTLRHFMNTLRPNSKASLRNLNLAHTAYGHPAKTDHQIWKCKADKAWENLCWRIAKECPAISHLSLDLDYQYSKLQFVPFFEARRHVFGTDWMMALWAFVGLELKHFACRIRSATTAEAVLEVECFKIRRMLLADAWDDEAEEGRDAFGFRRLTPGGKKERRAAAVLRITPSGEMVGLA